MYSQMYLGFLNESCFLSLGAVWMEENLITNTLRVNVFNYIILSTFLVIGKRQSQKAIKIVLFPFFFTLHILYCLLICV